MFNPREIQEKVKERLKFLQAGGRVQITEELIHETYKALMFEALEGARKALSQLESQLDEGKVHHHAHGWIMVSREQRAQLREHVRDLAKMTSPM